MTLRLVQGRVEDVRIALGAVAPSAMRARRAEEVLRGERLCEPTLKAAATAASTEVRPIDDFRAGAAYRRKMIEVLVGRGLRQIQNS